MATCEKVTVTSSSGRTATRPESYYESPNKTNKSKSRVKSKSTVSITTNSNNYSSNKDVIMPNDTISWNRLGLYINNGYIPSKPHTNEQCGDILIGVKSINKKFISNRGNIMIHGLFINFNKNGKMLKKNASMKYKDIERGYLIDCIKNMRNINDGMDLSNDIYNKLCSNKYKMPENYLKYDINTICKYKSPQTYDNNGNPNQINIIYVRIDGTTPHTTFGDKTDEYKATCININNIYNNSNTNDNTNDTTITMPEACLRSINFDENDEIWDTTFFGIENYEIDRALVCFLNFLFFFFILAPFFYQAVIVFCFC